MRFRRVEERLPAPRYCVGGKGGIGFLSVAKASVPFLCLLGRTAVLSLVGSAGLGWPIFFPLKVPTPGLPFSVRVSFTREAPPGGSPGEIPRGDPSPGGSPPPLPFGGLRGEGLKYQ